MIFKYLLGALFTLPLLPLMYLDGKRIRARVPRLPEASGPAGVAGDGHPKIKMIAIGESTIAGVGVATHEEGFTGSLARELAERLQVAVDWRVYARSGYRAREIRERILPKIEASDIDVVVIGLGGNDAFTLNTPWGWANAMRALLTDLRTKYPKAVIVCGNMPPIKSFPAFTPLIKGTIGNLVEILGKELEKVVTPMEGVHYYASRITLDDWIIRLDIDAQPSEFFSDGVHPSQLTYQTWGRDLAREMVESGWLLPLGVSN